MPRFHPTELRTARLALRWIDERDCEALFAVFSDPDVTRYWSVGAWTSMEQSLQAIRRDLACYADGTGLRLALHMADRPGLIGTIGLHRFVDQSRRCELGYALARPHWGQGYVSEALAAALAYGFDVLNLNRVEADIDPRNDASARVLERLGFRKEGYMPERWIVHGEMADTVNYGLLKRYWDERKQLVAP
jgi:[ribosomal protein S5]-alanine N-acetyltransferase